MTAKTPPVPKENRSPKGTGETRSAEARQPPPAKPADPEKQGQQANTKINTTHQGLQQDR